MWQAPCKILCSDILFWRSCEMGIDHPTLQMRFKEERSFSQVYILQAWQMAEVKDEWDKGDGDGLQLLCDFQCQDLILFVNTTKTVRGLQRECGRSSVRNWAFNVPQRTDTGVPHMWLQILPYLQTSISELQQSSVAWSHPHKFNGGKGGRKEDRLL